MGGSLGEMLLPCSLIAMRTWEVFCSIATPMGGMGKTFLQLEPWEQCITTMGGGRNVSPTPPM